MVPMKLTDDEVELFDKCLTKCNKILAPLTLKFEVGEITEYLLQQISTHMDVELCAIYNGKEDPCYGELSPANQKISRTTQKLKEKK